MTRNARRRLDRDVKDGFNVPNTFTGAIINRENIGKTSDDPVARWNEEYPDKPVS